MNNSSPSALQRAAGQESLRWHRALPLALMLALTVGSGCSIKRMAVNKLGDALAGSGSTFASDDDPELNRGASKKQFPISSVVIKMRPGLGRRVDSACQTPGSAPA